MKKEYVKPYLAVESFQLDAAIAANCSSQGYIPIGRSERDCPHDSGFFADGICSVDATGGDGVYDENDQLCYHGPEGLVFIYS